MKMTANLLHFIASVFCLMTSQTAFAHAKLLKSSPAVNETVHVAPVEVTLHFSEDLELSMSKIEVKNSTTGQVVSDGAASQITGDAASMRVALKPLKKQKAIYDVVWKAVARDAHKMPGHMSFTFDPKN